MKWLPGNKTLSLAGLLVALAVPSVIIYYQSKILSTPSVSSPLAKLTDDYFLRVKLDTFKLLLVSAYDVNAKFETTKEQLHINIRHIGASGHKFINQHPDLIAENKKFWFKID